MSSFQGLIRPRAVWIEYAPAYGPAIWCAKIPPAMSETPIARNRIPSVTNTTVIVNPNPTTAFDDQDVSLVTLFAQSGNRRHRARLAARAAHSTVAPEARDRDRGRDSERSHPGRRADAPRCAGLRAARSGASSAKARRASRSWRRSSADARLSPTARMRERSLVSARRTCSMSYLGIPQPGLGNAAGSQRATLAWSEVRSVFERDCCIVQHVGKSCEPEAPINAAALDRTYRRPTAEMLVPADFPLT